MKTALKITLQKRSVFAALLRPTGGTEIQTRDKNLTKLKI